MRTAVMGALLAGAILVSPAGETQDFDFDSDVKMITPTAIETPLSEYVVLKTQVRMTASDLLDYFRAAEPGASLSDFQSANPHLGPLRRASELSAGTVFVIPRPARPPQHE